VRAPGLLPVAWCPFSLFRPLGLVISYVVINTGLLFILLFIALCVKLDPGTHKVMHSDLALKLGVTRHLVGRRRMSSLGPRIPTHGGWSHGG
jgi:hypothetical protein